MHRSLYFGATTMLLQRYENFVACVHFLFASCGGRGIWGGGVAVLRRSGAGTSAFRGAVRKGAWGMPRGDDGEATWLHWCMGFDLYGAHIYIARRVANLTGRVIFFLLGRAGRGMMSGSERVDVGKRYLRRAAKALRYVTKTSATCQKPFATLQKNFCDVSRTLL